MLYRYSHRIFLAVVTAALAVPVWAAVPTAALGPSAYREALPANSIKLPHCPPSNPSCQSGGIAFPR
jgi:hypothetical protein